jgi:hypothetical protein
VKLRGLPRLGDGYVGTLVGADPRARETMAGRGKGDPEIRLSTRAVAHWYHISGDPDRDQILRVKVMQSAGASRESWREVLTSANVLIAAYLIFTCPHVAISAVSPGCLTCRGSARITLREHAPWVVAASIMIWLAAAWLARSGARVARCAMLVSGAVWLLSVGVASGWWLN